MDSRKPLFPLEVLERIVDEDVANPKLLSVSKDVRNCVLRHLFKTVEISNTDNRTEKLRIIIIGHTQPAASTDLNAANRYIKGLVLRFSYDHEGQSLHDFFDQDAVQDILIAIQLEGRLSNLIFTLAVNAEHGESKPHSWNDLSQRLADVPQELIPGRNLGTQTSALSSMAPNPVVKQKVKTDYAFRFTTIHALGEIWSDIEKVGSTMKKLKLTEKYEDYASAMAPSVCIPGIPAVTIIPNLRELAYVASSIDGRSPYLQILCGLLSVVTPHKGLKRLILDLKYETFIASIQEAIQTVTYRREMWARMDELLASGSFPTLSAIKITVKIPVCAPGLAQAPSLASTVETAVIGLFAASGQNARVSVKVNARSLKIRR